MFLFMLIWCDATGATGDTDDIDGGTMVSIGSSGPNEAVSGFFVLVAIVA